MSNPDDSSLLGGAGDRAFDTIGCGLDTRRDAGLDFDTVLAALRGGVVPSFLGRPRPLGLPRPLLGACVVAAGDGSAVGASTFSSGDCS